MMELTRFKCEEEDIEILAMECDVDHVYLFVNVYPQTSIQKIMGSIRSYTSKIIREEFVELSRMKSLWTRSYLVSTEYLSQETIRWYVEQQKTRE